MGKIWQKNENLKQLKIILSIATKKENIEN
jgi:hypothetical protein